MIVQRTAIVTVVVAAGAAALSAWQAPLVAAEATPKPTAEAVWNYLEKQDYRKTFELFPGKDRFYRGQEPHGALLTTYVNDTALGALRKNAQTMPHGSILVKENYTPDKRLAATTVMYKAAGYAPDKGDWFWMKREANGKVSAAGRVDSCIACHGAAKRDFILTPLP